MGACDTERVPNTNPQFNLYISDSVIVPLSTDGHTQVVRPVRNVCP